MEYFEDDLGRSPIEIFLDELPNAKFAAFHAALTNILARQGIALAGTNWMRPLGRGLHEFRIRHSEAEISTMHLTAGYPAPPELNRTRVLLRVFIHFYGERVCLLLSGYDKGKNPSKKRQQQEITKARQILAQFQRRSGRFA